MRMMMIMCISMLGRADSDERVFRSWLETAETLSRQLRLVTHHFSQARTSRRSVSGMAIFVKVLLCILYNYII